MVATEQFLLMALRAEVPVECTVAPSSRGTQVASLRIAASHETQYVIARCHHLSVHHRHPQALPEKLLDVAFDAHFSRFP